MELEQKIAEIESAGRDWVLQGGPDGSYLAVCEKSPAMYIADTLAIGLGVESGASPVEALAKAFAQDLG